MKQNKFLLMRQLCLSFTTIILLAWAFFQNQFMGKVIILPFFICSVAIFGESIFFLLQKEKIASIFQLIFRISFFTYAFGFLAYIVYDSIMRKNYSSLFSVFLFLLFLIPFCRSAFRKRK